MQKYVRHIDDDNDDRVMAAGNKTNIWKDTQRLCIHTLKANRNVLEYNFPIKRIAFSNEHSQSSARQSDQRGGIDGGGDGNDELQRPIFAAVARMNSQIEIWYTPSRQYEDWTFLKVCAHSFILSCHYLLS